MATFSETTASIKKMMQTEAKKQLKAIDKTYEEVKKIIVNEDKQINNIFDNIKNIEPCCICTAPIDEGKKNIYLFNCCSKEESKKVLCTSCFDTHANGGAGTKCIFCRRPTDKTRLMFSNDKEQYNKDYEIKFNNNLEAFKKDVNQLKDDIKKGKITNNKINKKINESLNNDVLYWAVDNLTSNKGPMFENSIDKIIEGNTKRHQREQKKTLIKLCDLTDEDPHMLQHLKRYFIKNIYKPLRNIYGDVNDVMVNFSFMSNTSLIKKMKKFNPYIESTRRDKKTGKIKELNQDHLFIVDDTTTDINGTPYPTGYYKGFKRNVMGGWLTMAQQEAITNRLYNYYCDNGNNSRLYALFATFQDYHYAGQFSKRDKHEDFKKLFSTFSNTQKTTIYKYLLEDPDCSGFKFYKLGGVFLGRKI